MKKLSKTIRHVGVVANAEKVLCTSLMRQAIKLLEARRRAVLADARTAALAGLPLKTCPDVAALARKVDLLIVFGGDGTMLAVAREVAGASTPILGINTGSLGFLTAVQAQQLPDALEQIWAGESVPPWLRKR